LYSLQERRRRTEYRAMHTLNGPVWRLNSVGLACCAIPFHAAVAACAASGTTMARMGIAATLMQPIPRHLFHVFFEFAARKRPRKRSTGILKRLISCLSSISGTRKRINASIVRSGEKSSTSTHQNLKRLRNTRSSLMMAQRKRSTMEENLHGIRDRSFQYEGTSQE
jgi:hypothetical protein